MPLINSERPEALSENIRTLRRKGKSEEDAVKIAYGVQKKRRKKKKVDDTGKDLGA